MLEIRRVAGHAQLRLQRAPVIRHLRHPVAAQPAQVIHHHESPARTLRSFPHMPEHRVVVLQTFGRLQIHHEPLHERAINPVLAHPLEVPQHRGLLEGTEHLRLLPARIREARGEPLVRAEFGNIRPQIDLGVTRTERPAALGPMNPAAFRAIARRIEPALVAAHHLARERARVHGGARAGNNQEQSPEAQELAKFHGQEFGEYGPGCRACRRNVLLRSGKRRGGIFHHGFHG